MTMMIRFRNATGGLLGVLFVVIGCCYYFVLSRNLPNKNHSLTRSSKVRCDTIGVDIDSHILPQPGYWPRYSGSRRVRLLDGIWNASISDDLERFDSMDPNLDISAISTTETVPVPSTIEVVKDPEHGYLPGYMGYRGVSFFRTQFTTIEGGRLQFQACSFYCRVWVNGVEIGDHTAGGYVSWWLDVPSSVLELGQQQQQKQQHELFVLVDNRFNSTTAPLHTGGDFWHYGGILRSVEWHERPSSSAMRHTQRENGRIVRRNRTGRRPTDTTNIADNEKHDDDDDKELCSCWPWRLYVHPQQDLGSVKLTLQLADAGGNLSKDDSSLLQYLRRNNQIIIYFDDDDSRNALSSSSKLSTHPASSHQEGKDRMLELGVFSVPNPRIWSITDPHLHTVSVFLNGAIVTERFGLRYWDVDETNNRIRLNGKDLKLVGWNHHTQWPYTGASPTDEQLDSDIRLLKETGYANFVRGAHYPQDPRWLDRLDEHGIVMWCETLGPGVSVANLQDESFLKEQDRQLNEMMDNAFNHPSIAFWGFFNEGPSHKEEACTGYQSSSDAIRARDSTRFITYASNRYASDKCYDAATVISNNGYPSWYSSEVPADFWNRLANDVRDGKPPFGTGKPYIISETGAGGIYEWNNNKTAVKWSLDFQTNILLQDVDAAIQNANISGLVLWHFFDFKVDDKWENNTHCDYLPGVEPLTCGYIDVSNFRPGGANHKGSVDFFRRPKPVFPLIASKYKNITSRKGRLDFMNKSSESVKFRSL